MLGVTGAGSLMGGVREEGTQMAIEYEVVRSETEGVEEYVDITVVFRTSNIGDAEAEAIGEQAWRLIHSRSLGYYREHRYGRFTSRGGRAILSLHYENLHPKRPEDMKIVESDFRNLLKHLIKIIEVFDAPGP
jgi:hypothetical protein